MRIKLILSLAFLFTSSGVFGFCLPKTLKLPDAHTGDLNELEAIAEDFRSTLLPYLATDEDLVIVFESLSPLVNAEIKKTNHQVVLELFGGMLRHPKMNESSFRLLLCHELGHVLGGPPLKSRTGWSSTEGQADYYSGSECARLLGMSESSVLKGALNLTRIYAEVMRHAEPQLESSDELRVERTNYGYPSAQCRLQTILAGWKKEDRPRCWFMDQSLQNTIHKKNSLYEQESGSNTLMLKRWNPLTMKPFRI